MHDAGSPPRLSASGGTALADRIFPTGEPRDGRVLRLRHVQTWESQFLGLGRTAEVLTTDVLRRNHAADDLGLALVFLQRHRVEVGLKLVMERTGGALVSGHRLQPLMSKACERCAHAGLAARWETFVADQAEYVDLMAAVDDTAATFRYPVDRRDQLWNRPALVDIEELATAGASYKRSLLQLVHAAEWQEPTPSASDPAAVISALADLSAACRAGVARSPAMLDELRAQRRRFGGRVRAEEDEGDAMVAGRAVTTVTLALADRTDRMIERLVAATGIEAVSVPPPPPPPMPGIDLAQGPLAVRHQLRDQERWMVETMVGWIRPMARAAHTVESLTADWSTPAAFQLHIDVVRFRSRLTAARPRAAEQVTDDT